MVLKTKRHVEAPPERPRAVPQLRPSRPVGTGGTVIAELIALDAAAAPRPLPTRNLIERLAFVSTAMHDDYARHLDTLAVLDDISAVLAEHPEALAPPSHPGIRLTLRRAHAELAALIPLAVAK